MVTQFFKITHNRICNFFHEARVTHFICMVAFFALFDDERGLNDEIILAEIRAKKERVRAGRERTGRGV